MATRDDVKKLAFKLGISQEFMTALSRVESGKQAYVDDRVIIRFEPHWFRNQSAAQALGILGKRKPTANEKEQHGVIVLLPGMKAATGDEGLRRSTAGGISGQQEREYKALAEAASYFEDAAYRSTSFGIGQIMGFNARAAGYKTAKGMYEAFQDGGAEEQWMGVLHFIEANGGMLRAARNLDFKTFATLYNGDPTDRYANLLSKTYSDVASA